MKKINFVPSHQSIYKEFHDFHCMLVNAYEIQIDNFKSNLIKEWMCFCRILLNVIYRIGIVYNHSLGISHIYRMFNHMLPLHQVDNFIPYHALRYHMHSFCIDFYALSVSILATCTQSNNMRCYLINYGVIYSACARYRGRGSKDLLANQKDRITL